jgi:hypothetical protein
MIGCGVGAKTPNSREVVCHRIRFALRLHAESLFVLCASQIPSRRLSPLLRVGPRKGVSGRRLGPMYLSWPRYLAATSPNVEYSCRAASINVSAGGASQAEDLIRLRAAETCHALN